MAIPEPSCNDGPNELLRKILLGLPDIAPDGSSNLEVQDEGVVLTADVASINFVGGGVTATAVGNNVTVTVPSPPSIALQSGSEPIGSGASTVSVVFPVAFGAPPDVVVSISRPVADPMIDVNIDEASITAAGFTCSLGAATINADYRLKWMANP